MGQGILSSRGGSGGGDWSVMPNFTGWEHKYEEITSNKDWIVPRAKDNTFNVIVFGGGGGYTLFNNFAYPGLTDYSDFMSHNVYGGGGGGYMCNATLKLQFGNEIRISIGDPGKNNTNGGTTLFGQYLSALGGECAKIVNMRVVNNGKNDIIIADGIQGGNGGTGGGSMFIVSNTGLYTQIPGGSGQYGGGGGGYIGGKGGIYGGNGGSLTVDAQDGTNTKPINTIYNGNGNSGLFFRIRGESDFTMNKKLCGGGGYGGNGGDAGLIYSAGHGYVMYYAYGGGGGGGWGDLQAGGGDANFYKSNVSRHQNIIKTGGGGGYKSYAYGASKQMARDGGELGDFYSFNSSTGKGVCVIDYIAPVFN